MKTQQEIDAEIMALRRVKNNPQFRQVSFFGDSNEGAINAQISVLEEKMDMDDVDEKMFDEEWDAYVVDHAGYAVSWLMDDTNSEESPSGGWL